MCEHHTESKLEFRFPEKPEGATKAYVDLTYGDFVIRGFRIVEKDGIPWVAMPSRMIPTADGSNEVRYEQVLVMPDLGRKKAFESYVLKHYRDELKRRSETQATK